MATKKTKKESGEIKVEETPAETTPATTPEEIRVQNVKEAEEAEARYNKLVSISQELNLEGVGTSPELIKAIEKAKANLDERKKLAGV